MEYYKESSEDFKAFLEQCKRAMNKCKLAFGSVKCDEWSGLYGNNGYDKNGNFTNIHEANSQESMTVWQGLNKYGTYQYNCEFYAIDFDFGRVVYTEMKE